MGLNGGGNLKFKDLNGRPLQLPPLVFPSRRALFYMASNCYASALSSKRPHMCATESCPLKDCWDAIKKTSMDLSDCDEALYFHDTTSNNDSSSDVTNN